MPDAIAIGPAAVPSQAIAALLALAAGALVFRLIGRNQPDLREELSALGDRVFTALLLAFVAWKLTPIFFWWDAIIQEPVRLLRLPGGRPGLFAGTAVILAMVVPRLWYSRHLVRPLLICVFSTTVSYAVVVAAISALAATTTAPPSAEIDRIRAPVFHLSEQTQQTAATDMLQEEALVPGNQPAIVTFWATWCGPCHAEIPVKQEAYRIHGDSLRFVAVNMTHTESGTGEVVTYVTENDLAYPILIDRNGSISALFGVRGTPTTVVLSAKGQVIDRWMGPSDLGRINRAVAQTQKSAAPSTGGRSN